VGGVRTGDREIVVVGAGPAGCWTARRLAERGRDVALLDENEGPRTDVVCTGIVGREAFERFPLPQEAVTDVVRKAFFFSPSGQAVPYEPSRPLARVVDRRRFDAALGRGAASAGATLLRGHAARAVRREDGRVLVTCRTPSGERVLGARALVVATGHQRWLHADAGLGAPRRYVHGVHADLPFGPLEGAELYFGNGIAPGFFAWAVPFGRGMARMGVLAPQGARRYFLDFLARPAIRRRLGPRVVAALEGGPGDPDAAWLASRLRSRGIVQGPVSPSYADRVLAVGEAAGQVKTTTAGGIYYGMLGADLAAGALDRALASDRLDAASLAGYEEAWRSRLGPEIDLGLRLQEAVRGLEDQQIERVFGALQNGVGRAVRRVVRFDWHRGALRVLLGGVLGSVVS
jgi:digeranylgeranylglycerophospholipid reductase